MTDDIIGSIIIIEQEHTLKMSTRLSTQWLLKRVNCTHNRLLRSLAIFLKLNSSKLIKLNWVNIEAHTFPPLNRAQGRV